MYIHVYTHMYTIVYMHVIHERVSWYSLQGVQWEGVQWMGVVSYNKLVYNIIQITTPCFHCTTL